MVRCTLVFAVLLISNPLWAASIGSLNALTGNVSVIRGGQVIPSEKVGEGFTLEPFDTVSTGALSRTDLRFSAALGVVATLQVEANTTLYLEASPLLREQVVGIELLTGRLGAKVTGVTGSSLLEVRTPLATVSATAATFRVVVSEWGDLLAYSSTGKLGEIWNRRAWITEPGTTFEQSSLDQAVFTGSSNVATQGAYEAAWLLRRSQSARDQGPSLFKVVASRYQKEMGAAQRAWDRVQKEDQSDLASWSMAISHLRRSAARLERSLLVVDALNRMASDGSLATLFDLSRGYSAKEFLRQNETDEKVWNDRLIRARSLYRALSDRSGGVFPAYADVPDVSANSGFFR